MRSVAKFVSPCWSASARALAVGDSAMPIAKIGRVAMTSAAIASALFAGRAGIFHVAARRSRTSFVVPASRTPVLVTATAGWSPLPSRIEPPLTLPTGWPDMLAILSMSAGVNLPCTCTTNVGSPLAGTTTVMVPSAMSVTGSKPVIVFAMPRAPSICPVMSRTILRSSGDALICG